MKIFSYENICMLYIISDSFRSYPTLIFIENTWHFLVSLFFFGDLFLVL